MPPAWRQALAGCQQRLRRRLGAADQALRWVRPESFHLTLVFLGDTEIAAEPGIVEQMTSAAAGVAPFRLALAELGSFGGRRPRVLWVRAVADTDGLALLQRRLAAALDPKGGADRFSPHITLARVRERQPDATGVSLDGTVLAAALAAVGQLPAAPFAVKGISLMQSELARGGAVYTRRASVPLATNR